MIYALLIFILVIMLKTFRFKSSVLFGTHNLLDKSLRVLQLPTHLSNLTVKWIVVKFLTVLIRMLINKSRLNLTFPIA